MATGILADRPLLNVHLYVTPICNLKCVHCYYDARILDASPGDLLSTDDLALIVRTLAEHFRSDIHMEGGELFLRPDLERIMDAVPEDCWSDVTITTGGTARINVGFDRLRRIGDIRVSVEGHTDDMQRRIRGVGLTKVLETCEILQSNGVAVTMRITLHRANVERIHEMLEFFLARGITRFSFFELQPTGRGTALVDLLLREAHVDRAMADLASITPDTRLTSLKVNLPGARVNCVEHYAERLRTRGYFVHHIGGVPSLTINSDGTLGCSPWSITADAVTDQVGSFNRRDFGSQVADLIASGCLSRPCIYSSEISIRYSMRAPKLEP